MREDFLVGGAKEGLVTEIVLTVASHGGDGRLEAESLGDECGQKLMDY